MDAHETLGVSPDATSEEVTQAYRRLARTLHPDVHPGSTPEERERYSVLMARVNHAYRSLAPPRGTHHARGWNPRDVRGPGRDECSMCGHAPATPCTFEYQEGARFSRRRYSFRSTLCRDCGRAVGRSHQDRTLRRGFWGPTLFVTNIGVVVRNGRSLRATAALRRPAPVAGVRARLPMPMPPGDPLALRTGFWTLPVVIVLLVCLGLGFGAVTGPDPSRGASFVPGACLAGRDPYTPVPCSDRHDVLLVTVVDRAQQCPAATDASPVDGRRVLCVRPAPSDGNGGADGGSRGP
jgi:DnaJ domain